MNEIEKRKIYLRDKIKSKSKISLFEDKSILKFKKISYIPEIKIDFRNGDKPIDLELALELQEKDSDIAIYFANLINEIDMKELGENKYDESGYFRTEEWCYYYFVIYFVKCLLMNEKIEKHVSNILYNNKFKQFRKYVAKYTKDKTIKEFLKEDRVKVVREFALKNSN